MSDGSRIVVPKDRVFERTQGCWNCSHSSKATQFWTIRRQADLNRALLLSVESPRGENDPRVVNIRRMVDQVDNAVASGSMLRCSKGKTADGSPVGDLVANNYLCDRWCAAPGASIARAGAKPDVLPEELVDKLDGRPAASDQLEELISSKPEDPGN